MKDESAKPKLLKTGKPEKLVFRAEEVCRMIKVDPETLDRWEKEFPFLNAGQTAGGKKYFRSKDVEIIRRIKELLDQKTFTQAGIRRHVEEEFGLVSSVPIHPDKLKKTLYQVRDELQEIAVGLKKNPKKR